MGRRNSNSRVCNCFAPVPMEQHTMEGDSLVGRNLLVCYTDGKWYSVIVVCYYEKSDEYKIVYLIDDGLQTLKLQPGRWILVPKRRRIYANEILEGAVIEFTYPTDGKRHRAMIYDYANTGQRVKIAYLREYHTDILKGGGWDIVEGSPCVQDPGPGSEAD